MILKLQNLIWLTVARTISLWGAVTKAVIGKQLYFVLKNCKK